MCRYLICLIFTLHPAVVAAQDGSKEKSEQKSEEKSEEKPQPPARPRRPAEPPQRVPRLVPGTQGELTKVEADSITFLPAPPRARPARGGGNKTESQKEEKQEAEPAPKEQTLAVDENTQVFVGAYGPERTLPRGQKIRSTRFTRGQRSDLKAGQKVLVRSTGDHADHISIFPTEAPEGEGL
jgi:hypothetical protein